jgi:hypothetical protein
MSPNVGRWCTNPGLWAVPEHTGEPVRSRLNEGQDTAISWTSSGPSFLMFPTSRVTG